jgi:hypothetical protein
VTVGSDVEVSAEFQGSKYKAKNVKVIGTNTRTSEKN